MEDNYNFEHKILEKKKNANERELERYLEDKRQKRIQNQLSSFRKQKQNELWRNNAMLTKSKIDKKNVFNHGESILKHG